MRKKQYRNAPQQKTVLASYINGDPLRGLPTTSRSGSLWLPDASGALIEYTSGNVGIVDGDAVWCQPEAQNKCTNHNADPTDTTGLSDGAGSPISNGWVTIVSDDTDLAAAGLANIASKAIKIDIPSGEASGDYVVLADGQVGNTNDHTVSVYAKKESGKTFFRMGLAAQVANVDVDGSGYFRYDATITPGATTRQMAFGVSHANGEASTFYFCLNQMEESSYVTPPIVVGGSTDTAGPTEPVVAWPSWLDNDFVVKLSLYTDGLAQDGRIFDLRYDNSNFIMVQELSSNFRFCVRRGGVEKYVQVPWTTGEWTDIFVLLSSTQGLKILSGGNIDTDATTGAITPDTDLYLGKQNGSSTNDNLCKIKDVRIKKVHPDITDANVLAL